MNNVRDIAGMADVDRKWLGEGIFGGYRQDLESQMRNLGLGLEIDSAAAEGERLDQALSSNALAEYLGVPAGTLMGGMVGGVDIPGMSFATQEREGAQDFAAAEALLGRDWQSAEAALGRGFATKEREAGQIFAGDENALDRAIQEQAFAEQQRQFNQGVRSDAAENIRTQGRWQQTFDQTAEANAAELAAIQEANAEASKVAGQQYRDERAGYDMNPWITVEGGVQRPNPTYGMSPTEKSDYEFDLIAAMQEDPVEPPEPVEKPEDWLFREMLYAAAGDIELAGKLSQAVKNKIGANENVMGGGVTENNVLFALSILAGEGGDYADHFAKVYNLLLPLTRMADYGIDWE